MLVKYLAAWALFFLYAAFFPAAGAAAGWYLRGAAGYDGTSAADFSDKHCGAANPPALFGCAAGNNGRPIGAYGDFGHFPLAEAAVGRRLRPWLRADLALAYRFRMNYDGQANFITAGARQPVSARAYSVSGMVNLFLDVDGLLAGKKLGRFQPYAGVGAGLSYNRIGRMTFRFPDNPSAHKLSITPAGGRKDLAFMLAVGTGYSLTERLSLDIAYRYFDLGRLETSSGNMYMDTLPAGIVIAGIDAPLRTHGLTAGLRYKF